MSQPSSDGEPLSTVLAALEATWQAIRDRHPEIPSVVLLVASGSSGGPSRWGHHAPGRWQAGDLTRAEVMISGEGLRRGAQPVLGTVLHEAAHALAAARGIRDTSRQGRYHNRQYKTLAEELGINVAHDPSIGWSATTVPAATTARYTRQTAALDAAITLWRHHEQAARTGRRSTNLIAACCPCGRSIRIAATTLAGAPVVCGACGGSFAPKHRP